MGAGTAVLTAGAEAGPGGAADGITPVVGAPLAAGAALSNTLPQLLTRAAVPLLPR